MLWIKSTLKQGLSYLLSFGMLCPHHFVLANSFEKPSASTFSVSDIDSILSQYDRARLVYNDFGLDAFVDFLPFLNYENTESLRRAFAGIRELPAIERKDSKIIIQGSNESFPLEKLSQGILEIAGREIKLKKGLGFLESLAHIQSKPVSQILIEELIPKAQASLVAASVIAILGALIAALFGAKNWNVSRKAEKAREEAYRTGAPLGPETLYGSERGPQYGYSGFIDRIFPGGSSGSFGTPGGNTSDELVNFQQGLEGNPKCNSEFNKLVLKNIPLIEQEAKESGKSGYSMSNGGFNLPLNIGPHSVAKGTKQKSHCSAATYTAFIKTLDQYLKLKNISLSSRAASHFGAGPSDDVGGWGIWNNNHGGASDLAHYYNSLSGGDFASKTSDPADACPGDFVKFDRNGKPPGHSVVFLGYKGTGANKQFCYWSSNGSTNGYGVNCENVSRLKRYSILKIHKPEVIGNITQSFDDVKNNPSLSGKALYSAHYSRDEKAGLEKASAFHAKLSSLSESTPTPASAAAKLHE